MLQQKNSRAADANRGQLGDFQGVTPMDPCLLPGGAEVEVADLDETVRRAVRSEWVQLAQTFESAMEMQFRRQERFIAQCLEGWAPSPEDACWRPGPPPEFTLPGQPSTSPKPSTEGSSTPTGMSLQASLQRIEAKLDQKALACPRSKSSLASPAHRALPKSLTAATQKSTEPEGSERSGSKDQSQVLKRCSTKCQQGTPTKASSWSVDIQERLDSLTSSPMQRKLYMQFLGWMEWWTELQEPPRNSCIARFVGGRSFECLCAAMIILNACFTIHTSDHEITNLGKDPTAFIVSMEVFFLCFYGVELLLKIFVHRHWFFCNEDMKWNLFDFFLVVFAIYDRTAAVMMQSSGMIVNLTFMRTLRVIKMAKILRVVRVMRFFTELRLMLNSVLGSFVSLFWAFAMLLFIFYIFALVFVQGVTSYLLDHGENLRPETKEKLMYSFGSVSKAMITLYKAVTGGADWEAFYDNADGEPMLSETSTLNAGLFLFFVFFIQIALLNILTGIFVENAMKLAQPDRDALAFERRKQDMNEAIELKRLCMQVDADNTGTISVEEFRQSLNSKLKAYFAVMGLDIKDAEMFFEMLSSMSDDQEVAIDDFVIGCMKLKGTATSLDLQSLIFETKQIYKNQKQFHDSCLESMDEFREQLCSVSLASQPPPAQNSVEVAIESGACEV